MTDAQDTRIPTSGAGCFLLAMPPVAVVLVFIAYGVLLFFGISGRPADGETVDIAIRTCPEAQAVLAARAEMIGVVPSFTPTEDGFRITVTLPSDEVVAASIPGTLAERGLLEVRAEDGTLLVDSEGVADAGIRMDLMMTPTTFVAFTDEAHERLRAHMKANRNGKLSVTVDGAEVAVVSNRMDLGPGELEILPSAENEEARMRLSARRGVVLGEGPLPCDAEVLSVAASR